MTSLRSPCAFKAGRFSGQDFALQPDGGLYCPAGKTLRPRECPACRPDWEKPPLHHHQQSPGNCPMRILSGTHVDLAVRPRPNRPVIPTLCSPLSGWRGLPGIRHPPCATPPSIISCATLPAPCCARADFFREAWPPPCAIVLAV